MTDKTLLEILDEHARSVEELRLQALEMSANVNIVLDELDRLRIENRHLKADKVELKLKVQNMEYFISTVTNRVMVN
jgi:predicted nuclease with TOPRIM domain